MEKKVIEHFLKRKETYIKKRKFKGILNKSIICEVGCGARPTYRPTSYFIGVDIVPELLRELKREYESNPVIADARKLPIRDDVSEVVVSNMLLHHIVGVNVRASDENVVKTIKEFKRIVKDNGEIRIHEWLPRNHFLKYLMYNLTRFLSDIKMECPYLGIYKGVITNFNTETFYKKIFENLGLCYKVLEFHPWIIQGIVIGRGAWMNLKK